MAVQINLSGCRGMTMQRTFFATFLPFSRSPRRSAGRSMPAVGAGADDHLVDLHLAPRRRWYWVFSGRWGKDTVGRRADRSIVHIPLHTPRPRRRRNPPAYPWKRPVTVGQGHVVHRENAVFRAGLNGHVGDAEPVVHGKVLQPRRRRTPWTDTGRRPRRSSR